jgi:hypothetical protein
MKRIITVCAVAIASVTMNAQVTSTPCNGVILKDGSASYRSFNNGSQVIFDFCGYEATLKKHQDRLDAFGGTVQMEYTAVGENRFLCTISIADIDDKAYVGKVFSVMGLQVIQKGDKALHVEDSAFWFN